MPPELASQTLAFLFTDIEGSTRLWEQHRQPMKEALERHDAILREAVESSNGQVVKSTGDGLMAVFGSAADGVTACLKAQDGLARAPWGETGALRVRMALHAGEAARRNGDYYGPTLNRTARVMSAGHGGQVLLSAAAAALVMDQLPKGSTLRDLGEQRLKDLGRPERVFQLVHPDLPASFPPLVTLSHRTSELPDQPSVFVGRAAELKEIGERLGDESVRLLTLTGPGGIGKTRLALRAAADQVDRFEDGALFVDLSAARDSDSVLAAIARTIGLSETPDEPLLDELTRQLREQGVLLVLDNFEQVTAAAPTAAQLLHGCPRLKLLVTSREALHLRGEHLLAVPPLALPSGSRREASAAQLLRYEAIQLFVERARAVRPDFRLTDDNAAAVVEICLRLDGLPLAIELATARINLFSPEALRDRLGRRLQLLGSGAQDLPARQQTLRATIEWSYQLLEPGEQRLFELLAAFSDISFDALDAVASSIDRLRDTGIDTLDGLASLVDKSLIKPVNAGTGEPRLVMLETIREYAAERLDDLPEFSAAVRRAHAVYFANFARRHWQQLSGDERDTALASMADEIDNLRLAWRYWVDDGDLDQLNELVDSLWLLYDRQGSYHATIELTRELLNVLSSTPSTPARAMEEVTLRTSLARALMAIHGYTQEVEDAYASALELFEGERELPQLFPVLRGLASFYNYRAEFDKGAQVGREILRLADVQADPSMRVDGHLVLGSSLALQHDLHAGLDHLERAIASFESQGHRARRFRLGNNPGIAAFTTSALTLWMLGFPDRALERATRAVTLATELEHPFTLAYALFHTGFLHLWRREPELLRDRAVGLLDVADEHDLHIWRALGTCLLGAAKTGLGRSEEGLAEIRDGIALYQGLRTPPVFWPLILFVRAGACARSGRPAEGLGLIEEAIEIADQGSGLTLLPEFYSLKGDLLLLIRPANGPNAEPWFQRAFDTARGLDARMTQLRAAIGLCRSQRDRGDAQQGRELLSAVYSTFTEGFTTPDLIDAGHFLDTGRAGRTFTQRRATRTFLFTDIVKSTALVEAIGDEAWEHLVQWHDETLRRLFVKHRGEEIDHAGDGFFIAFEDNSRALGCAVDIQRTLTEHRRAHGFSPQVRIGVHTCQATRTGLGYQGKGVHVAARIAAEAQGGEILASGETVSETQTGLATTEPRTVKLKGLAEPVRVAGIIWS
jgi:predicted ATPase/class 3 adenylate cyclase